MHAPYATLMSPHEVLLAAAPEDFRRGRSNQEVGRLGRIGEVAAEARHARAEVRAVLGVQVHAAVRAQECRLAEVLRQDLQVQGKPCKPSSLLQAMPATGSLKASSAMACTSCPQHRCCKTVHVQKGSIRSLPFGVISIGRPCPEGYGCMRSQDSWAAAAPGSPRPQRQSGART